MTEGIDRRRFLRLGVFGAGLAVLGWFSRRVHRVTVLEAVAARLFPFGTGEGPSPQTIATSADAFLVELPRAVRWQFQGVLLGLEWSPILRHGHRFSRLDGPAQDAVLQKLSTSRVYRKRQAFSGLKQACAMGTYQHDSTWPALAYPGPLLER